MEKLFALKNMGIQPIVDLYSDEINTAYTDKLLQLGVLIEFSGVAVHNDPHLPEGTSISASLYTDGVVYSYILFVSNEILGPLPVFRIIADAVEFIESCHTETVIEDLKQIVTSYSALNENYQNKEYYENEVWKHTTALELIWKKREQVN